MDADGVVEPNLDGFGSFDYTLHISAAFRRAFA